MSSEDWSVPRIVEVPAVKDTAGSLGVIEKFSPFPFPIKRVYFLYDVPSSAMRGSHAHKSLNQLIVPISGSFEVALDNGRSVETFQLTNPTQGLAVPPGYWRTLQKFSSGSAALVLASEEYDPLDYIRDYDEFVAWSNAL